MHAVIELRDHWVLLGLRRPAADYDPLTWSATFEEQVDLLGEQHPSSRPDRTVGDTLRRGLVEEFGIDPGSVRRQALLSIAIVRTRKDLDDGRTRILNAGVLVCAARLALSVDEAFDALSDRAVARDREEHVGWMALRMTKASDVNVLLAITGNRGQVLSPDFLEHHDDLGIAVRVHPTSQPAANQLHGWHPTSRQRLYLWSRWMQEP